MALCRCFPVRSSQHTHWCVLLVVLPCCPRATTAASGCTSARLPVTRRPCTWPCPCCTCAHARAVHVSVPRNPEAAAPHHLPCGCVLEHPADLVSLCRTPTCAAVSYGTLHAGRGAGGGQCQRVSISTQLPTYARAVHVPAVHLLAPAPQDEVLEVVRGFNENPDVHGILVQLPLPKHIDEQVGALGTCVLHAAGWPVHSCSRVEAL